MPERRNMNRRNEVRRAHLRFSPLTDADVPDIEAMVLALYREDPTGQKMSLRKIRRTVAELCSHPDRGSITIMHVGKIVAGYAVVIYFWSNEYGGNIAHIDELYVRPQWRSRGIGASFIEHVAKTKGKRLKSMRLEATPANERAFVFYSRHGFKLVQNRHMCRELP
jgi:ribosomal protein S18 acetylase RimI-like enzyme